MKTKSIAMTVRDALWEFAKSPSAKGKPVYGTAHLQRVKRNGVETGELRFWYDGADRNNYRTGVVSEIMHVTKRGRITLFPEFHGSNKVFSTRMHVLTGVVRDALLRAGYDNVRINLGRYGMQVQLQHDLGAEPTDEYRAEFLKGYREGYYKHQYKDLTDEEIFSQNGLQRRWDYGGRWYEDASVAYGNSYYNRINKVVLIPKMSEPCGYVVEVDKIMIQESNGLGILKGYQKKKFFKVMGTDGKAAMANFKWDLPKSNNGGDEIPGDWYEVEGDLQMCRTGIHVADAKNLAQWANHEHKVICEMEIEGPVYTDGNQTKVLCRKARCKRIVARLDTPEFAAYQNAVGRDTAIERVAKGHKPPKVYTAQVNVTLQRRDHRLFTSTSLKDAKRMAREWAAYAASGNEIVVKTTVKRVDNG